MIPEIPTPLVEVRVQARHAPGVPGVVLVSHPGGAASPAGDQAVPGTGADEIGVDEHWLARYRVRATLLDVATLTGAMKVSLGLRTGGLFATRPGLAERIQAAGAAVGEPWWPMPLIDDHAEGVRSDLADLRQCPPGPPGITAALFLREFTAGLPWAHLDIAGPARAEQDYAEVNAGGTGFATRTLIELACSLSG